jgi:hypothetical protein
MNYSHENQRQFVINRQGVWVFAEVCQLSVQQENIYRGSSNWIDLAQDRDKWQAVVNTVMNLRVPQNGGNFLSSVGI